MGSKPEDVSKIMPAYLTIRGAVAYSGLQPWQWRDLIRKKQIESVMPFKKRLIPMTEIHRILGTPRS
jgi:hypothetical protein